MSKKILILQNSHEGPGHIAAVLSAVRIPFAIMRMTDEIELPEPSAYGAVIVLGGADSANDTTPKMQKELAFIRKTLAEKIPYLGICLGLQTLVKAAGGNVTKSPVTEIGFRDPDGDIFTIALTAAGKEDPLLQDLPENLPAFQLHGEMVEPTAAMTVLGTGKFCPPQIVKVGSNAYGIQCHFELNDEILAHWHEKDSELQKRSFAELQSDFESLGNTYRQNATTLVTNFLKLAGL